MSAVALVDTCARRVVMADGSVLPIVAMADRRGLPTTEADQAVLALIQVGPVRWRLLLPGYDRGALQ